mmetsp:Transcript_82260/g.166697  ORF Transcript_82260/g.166697 Transcript_82260/m.166697 type:complete len:297 (+) Transcript_82260:99-989(+)
MVQHPTQVLACKVYPASTAFEAANEDELRRMYFQTTQCREFRGLMCPPDSRGENMRDVHSVGQRTSKYMKYQAKKAPLLDRSSCRYTEEFVVLPLGDNIIARDMAEQTKRGNTAPAGTSEAKFNGATKYDDDFRPPTADQARRARQKSLKPKAGKMTTLPHGGVLLENRSATHLQYGIPNLELAHNERATPPRPNLQLPIGIRPPPTTYKEHFPAYAPRAPLKVMKRPSTASSVGGSRGSRPETPGGSDVSATQLPARVRRCTSAPAGGRRPVLDDRELTPSEQLLRRFCYLAPGQ